MALVIARVSDTVASLARRFSVSEQELRDCNGLSDPQPHASGGPAGAFHAAAAALR